MNELNRLNKTRNVFIFIGILFLSSCSQKPEANEVIEEPLIVGGPVHNFAVLNGDTISEGGWDTGLKSININGDTVVYDCSHLFQSYYWRWCDDSLLLLDTNVVLNEINQRINFVDSNFWCSTAFSLTTERTDSSFFLSSQFYHGDTIFYQKSHWGLKDYWPID